MAVKGILFDLDGTLIDSRRDIANCVNFTLAELGHAPLSVERVERMVGDGVRQLLSRAIGPMDEPTQKRALEIFLPYYRDHCTDTTRLYPGVIETLRFFAGMGLALVTNKPMVHTEKTLATLGLNTYFPVVLGGDSLARRKPDPEPLWEALRRLDVFPGDAVMVGDSPMDIQAARSAGVRVVAVSYGFRTEEELQSLSPDFLISDFTQLREVLK
ncbi:MAG: phosphoglycolate phosphatase [Elusimicrobia bacterium]|jgi:phosphoglycolate phosphatase|nr:phosphoglycolate phosphatase [Elusimicrobiota bacterium]